MPMLVGGPLSIAALVIVAAETNLLAPGAKLETVTGDLEFSEGPAWRPDGVLLFEDIPRNRIMQLSRDGKVSVYREPSGHSNGLAFDAKGRLVAAEGNSQGGGRRISRTEKNGRVTSVVDSYQGKRLNSPNDLAIDRKGRIYFTDPRYGSTDGVVQDKEAVYRVDPNGTVTRIIDTLARPNGIALAPDERTLYVSDNNKSGSRRALWAFELSPAGVPLRPRVVYDFGAGRGVDGMAIDREGRIWATAGTGDKAGVYVLTPAGELLTVIATPEDPTNCTFGGPGRRTLFVTTAHLLLRIETRVQGKASPPGK
jgi:gluconolactonase